MIYVLSVAFMLGIILLKGVDMYKRIINLLDILGDTGILKAEIMDKVIDNSAHLLSYETEYDLTQNVPYADDDYSIEPTPYNLAKDCSNELFGAIRKAGGEIDYKEFKTMFLAVASDAEKWEDDNWDMLLSMKE
jgi:hypothetical protein